MLNLAQRLMLDRFSPSENCLFNSETTAEVDSSLVLAAMVDVFITMVAGICGRLSLPTLSLLSASSEGWERSMVQREMEF